MTRARVAAVLLLAGCHRGDVAEAGASSGDRLEAAAVGAGLVADPAARSLVGSWARDTDRACVVPGQGGAERLGVMVDYGAGQGCAGRGTVRRRGEALDVTLGGCRFTARFDGERIVFPAELPTACDRLCTGRASLAALSVEPLSSSIAEAQNLRSSGGQAMCGS